MSDSQFVRTELMFGQAAMKKLQNSRVAVFGVGGVGGYVVEALVRSGIGILDVIDNDKVCLSNLNRQIIATHKTLGQYKVDVIKERILEINPNAIVNIFKIFYAPETSSQFDFSKYDYIVDAIDTVSGKIELVVNAKHCNVPIICSMGAGNKFNPTLFEVADISKTSVCPLAKVMRQELKKRGIKNVKVVFSKEIPFKAPKNNEDWCSSEVFEEFNGVKRIPASNAFVPAAAGLIIASVVVQDLITPNPM